MEDLVQAADALLAPLGFEVLELDISGQGKKRRLLLRIDRLDRAVVTMEDVILVTQVFGVELDRLDPFQGEYKLEVESPGPERPLKRAEHFARFHDLLAKVRVGSEQFKGVIRQVDDDAVTFEVQGQARRVAIADIDSARLAQWPDSPR